MCECLNIKELLRILTLSHCLIVSKHKSFHFILFRIMLLMFFVLQPHKSIHLLLPKH